MITLDAIEQHLASLNKEYVKSSARPNEVGIDLSGITFDSTQNKSLGFSGPDDFTVFMPWRTWADSKTRSGANFPSPLQEAFKDVLKHGQSSQRCFIDISNTWQGNDDDVFWTQDGKKTPGDEHSASVAQALRNFIKAYLDNNENAEVVVRFLIGHYDPKLNFEFTKPLVEKIFWPGGTKLEKGKNVKLYFGHYGPSFKLSDPNKDHTEVRDMLKKIGRDLETAVAWISSRVPKAAALARSLKQKFDDETTKLMQKQIDQQQTSWIHGKILAVNGKTLLTGGANYWWQNADDKYNIIEQSCKLEGDATKSAHLWQDYVYAYLVDQPGTDNASFLKVADLTAWPPNWTKPGEKAKAPMFRSSMVPTMENTKNGKYKVLTTSCLGDWHDEVHKLAYPVQVIQAVKDLISNALWHYTATLEWLEAFIPKETLESNYLYDQPWQGMAVVLVDALFTESQGWRTMFEATIGTTLGDPYAQNRINPTAWSSRIARLYAIASAEKSVILCQQRLVLPSIRETKPIVDKINEHLETKGKKGREWDGSTWPYDLLIALCYALLRTRNSETTGTAKIKIVLSSHDHRSGDPHESWADDMKASDFMERLKIVMTGLKTMHDLDGQMRNLNAGQTPLGMSVKKVDEIVAALKNATDTLFPSVVFPEQMTEVVKLVDDNVQIKRVLKGDASPNVHYNHSKVVLVDDAVMYMGSDNAYPSYNEEHGIWIEDQDTIKAWKKKVWDEMWESQTNDTKDVKGDGLSEEKHAG